MVWKGSPAECGMSCRFWTGGVLNNSAAMPLILLKGEWPLRFRTANCARPALEERTDMKYLTAPLLIALAGCASAQTGEVANPLTNSTTGEACRSEPLNQFVGQTADADLGAKLMTVSGARCLRWVAPGMAVTMEFRPERLTVRYAENL